MWCYKLYDEAVKCCRLVIIQFSSQFLTKVFKCTEFNIGTS